MHFVLYFYFKWFQLRNIKCTYIDTILLSLHFNLGGLSSLVDVHKQWFKGHVQIDESNVAIRIVRTGIK